MSQPALGLGAGDRQVLVPLVQARPRGLAVVRRSAEPLGEERRVANAFVPQVSGEQRTQHRVGLEPGEQRVDEALDHVEAADAIEHRRVLRRPQPGGRRQPTPVGQHSLVHSRKPIHATRAQPDLDIDIDIDIDIGLGLGIAA
jgi:hypothetical protein